MKLDDRIAFLQNEHNKLDRQIDHLSKHTITDDEKMTNLKKKRLQIKDQLAILRRRQFEESYETINWEE